MDNQSDFGNKLAQLDQLLRLYRACKKDFGQELAKTVKSQADGIVLELKALNCEMYSNAQQKIKNLIFLTFQERSAKVDGKRSQKLSIASVKSQQSSGNSFKQMNQNSNNEKGFMSQQSSPFNSSNQVPVIKKVERQFLQQSIKNLQSYTSIKSSDRISNPFQQSSIQISGQSNTSMNIKFAKNFIRSNIGQIENKIAINYDLMMDAKLAKGQVYLVGIHLQIDRPIICTKMKLYMNDIQNRQDNYQRELSEFRNTQRHPVGIFLNGNIQDLKPHFLYLLSVIDSPWPLVFIMKDIASYDGVLIKYNANTVRAILQADFQMLNSPFNSQLVRNPENFKTIKIADSIQLLKQKTVVSKTLTNNSKYEKTQKVSHAIQIFNGSVKEESETFKFPYKFHAKFLTSMKGNFDIYVINNQNVMAGRKKHNDFASFQSQVQKLKLPFILSMGVTKPDKVIEKGFLIAVLKTNEADPFGIINLVWTKEKKTIIFMIKPGVTEQKIKNSQNLTFAIIQTEQNEITIKIDVITSKNYKNYQCESKLNLTQLKSK